MIFISEKQQNMSNLNKRLNIYAMSKINSAFLEKLDELKNLKDSEQVNNTYSLYTNQYLIADEEQRKWMDKNADYILNKIKTLEKKYNHFEF